ncbi:ribosome maturation factor RimP [Fulvivirgaceae bacterium PWU5]|uniref:Ribosome maturation factor RimP n=1 Tax=Dawidia cretensis TaxID=2782350 RepID=A0AAP2DTB8_9BACT|nr:ribosome maturation factor RimP [Dawidia cretensis]MBT1706896.1 ribosome maturation factor RimP [Dawidia cretensis]
MDIAEEIKRIATSKLTDSNQFVVDVIVSSKRGPRKVLVLLDGDNGISIDACAELSRALAQDLDEVSWLEEAYTLEVSTPGVDHPLKLQRQYPKHIGRSLRVKLADKTVEGKLVAIEGEKMTLAEETGSGKKKVVTNIDIVFSEIEKALVLVSFK